MARPASELVMMRAASHEALQLALMACPDLEPTLHRWWACKIGSSLFGTLRSSAYRRLHCTGVEVVWARVSIVGTVARVLTRTERSSPKAAQRRAEGAGLYRSVRVSDHRVAAMRAVIGQCPKSRSRVRTDDRRGSALLFGMSLWLSHNGIRRMRRPNLTRVLIAAGAIGTRAKARTHLIHRPATGHLSTLMAELGFECLLP